MFTFPLLLTIYAGFIHAFEADHLLAVSNIVSQRNNVRLSLKDGIFWGLGHTSTIFFVGILMIVFKAGISDQYFRYFESLVGVMLIALAIYRMVVFFREKKVVIHAHPHQHGGEQHKHLHVHVGNKQVHQHTHSLAYGVGLVHGLAGSGALILIAMSQMKSPTDGLVYLIIFGLWLYRWDVGCSRVIQYSFFQKNNTGAGTAKQPDNNYLLTLLFIWW